MTKYYVYRNLFLEHFTEPHIPMYEGHTTPENVALAERLMDDYHSMELPAEPIPWKEASEFQHRCHLCSHFASSTDRRPAHPENGNIFNLTHLCLRCGRRWWQYNSVYHLWQHVTDPVEWDTLRRQQIMLNGGFGLPGADQ